MNLNDYESFAELDVQNMLGHIDALPDQLEKAWSLGQAYPLPVMDGVRNIVIAGMGGSAIGADLLAAYVADLCAMPVYIHRDYDLPAWVHGAETLLIASSHSGNTEETLSAFTRAQELGCRLLAVSTGGRLKSLAEEIGIPWWGFEHQGQPRAAVGFSFGLLLALFSRLGLIPNQAGVLQRALDEVRALQETLQVHVHVSRNPAKRMAGQLYGRWVTVIAAGLLAPVARRWKGQINEVAKAWAQFDLLPEADHNTLAGVVHPAEQLEKMMVLFLRYPGGHPRNQMRTNLTRQMMMIEGLNTDIIEASGSNALAHMWTALLFGDYVSYYLAMMYEVDPTPIPAIEGFKQMMK